MACNRFCFALIFTSLTGTHSLTTVSQVSVQTKSSITIPCVYDREYETHVKYWCRGKLFLNCEIVLSTSWESSNSREWIINDDKNKTVFTVTASYLKSEDRGYYWCGIKLPRHLDPSSQRLHLSVTSDIARLRVDQQEVLAVEGESVTVGCHSEIRGKREWCRLSNKPTCVELGKTDETSVIINGHNSFHVLMESVKMQSSGWYYFVNGDWQMPVHITVQKPTTRITTTTMVSTTPKSIRVATHSLSTRKHSETVAVAPGGVNEAAPAEGGQSLTALKKYHILLISLSLLIVAIVGALFSWRMIVKRRKNKMSEVSEKGSEATATDADVTYINVHYHINDASGEGPGDGESDPNVTYSTVTSKQRGTAERSVPADIHVVYNAVAAHQK